MCVCVGGGTSQGVWGPGGEWSGWQSCGQGPSPSMNVCKLPSWVRWLPPGGGGGDLHNLRRVL
jgi:hypothetical protein